ncbi:tripartite ATP-independent transporter solute receptor, DctP family [Alteribacillus persepolensis]|uniref:Tripartite ATP-independent transporter solute receptor, DctP family n=1 Tax=Alteribacillus persepolensis TaxID=568899 RepID=A0A1G8KAA4_9BACI|nr:DctP family TRAP transporter solute-binding subunit [Alteribacillus persepolensis]SDI40289.1 tripartite ATP-independent transporter solute receptor, DctP family [Alteribacillus persepolensis]
MKLHIYSIMTVMILALLLMSGCSTGVFSSTNDPAEAKEPVTLQVGHVAPPNHAYHLGLVEFKEAVEEETNGQINIEIYPAGQMGGDRSLVERVQYGSLDMALSSTGVVGNFIEDIAVVEMPFLFNDLNHAYETFDGEIGQELLHKMENINIKGIAFWEKGFVQLSNNKHPIYSPEDVSGLKMRSLENELYVDTYDALGAEATPIANPEVYTSLQQGIVDGVDNALSGLRTTNQFEVSDKVSVLDLYYASAILMINQEKLESLPEQLQDAIIQIGRETASVQREINQQLEEQHTQEMKDEGATIVTKEEIDIDAFKEAVEEVYEKHDKWDDYVERIKQADE